MASLKITLAAVDPATGDCTFTFQKDGGATINQKVAGMPVTSSVDEFVKAATKYAVDYHAGLDTRKPSVVSPEITALVGQSTTVTV